MQVPPTRVLITGASSGFGEEFAHRFAAAGSHVVLVARRADRLTALAGELESRHGITATPIPTDLAAPGAAARLVQELAERNLAVDGLINNAGFGIDGPFATSDPDRARELLQVNVVALTELTLLLLPRLLDAPAGILVNVASTASYQPVPGIALYAASKAYVRSLTEAVWAEARDRPLRVLTLCPGPTETEFFTVAGSERFKVGQVLPIADVIDAALSELDRGASRPSRIVGWRNALTAHAARIAPSRLSLATAARLTES